jgi:hypothetical protein
MGQVHSKKNVCQNQCPNIGDYHIIYGSTQMFASYDADWASNINNYKSTSSYGFILENGAIN